MAAAKVAQRRELTSFAGQQAQILAQKGVAKTNEHVDTLRVLNNRAYVALAVDTTIATAAYATLLSTNITTLMLRGFLIITFSASAVQITNIGSPSFEIVVDGVVAKGCYVSGNINFAISAAMVVRVAVTRGLHTVVVKWRTTANSVRINANTVVEEHAHLLVQEAA